MFHACVRTFDVTDTVEFFLGTKQGIAASPWPPPPCRGRRARAGAPARRGREGGTGAGAGAGTAGAGGNRGGGDRRERGVWIDGREGGDG